MVVFKLKKNYDYGSMLPCHLSFEPCEYVV